MVRMLGWKVGFVNWGHGNRGLMALRAACLGMGDGSHLVKCLTLVPQGHSSFITHLDWSKDGNFIMSNSGDYEILYCEWQGDGDNLNFFFIRLV